MSKIKILVTGVVPEAGLAELRKNFTVDCKPEKAGRDWVLAHLPEYDGLVLMGLQGDRELIDAGTNLKIITAIGVGFDHIDIEYAKQKKIVVTNCPQSVLIPTAEMTFALILATVRRLHFYDKTIREGKWVSVSKPENMGTGLQGKTLGIYGMGRIGSQVAKYAQVFGMKVIYHNRHQLSSEKEAKMKVNYVDFATLVKTADVITLHAPATPATTGVFNKQVFQQMKKTAYIINAARGKLIKQTDLIAALQNGDIAGAGLDVYETEPEVPLALRALDNVVLSPHAGAGTQEARISVTAEAAQNLISYFRDHRLINQVNK